MSRKYFLIYWGKRAKSLFSISVKLFIKWITTDVACALLEEPENTLGVADVSEALLWLQLLLYDAHLLPIHLRLDHLDCAHWRHAHLTLAHSPYGQFGIHLAQASSGRFPANTQSSPWRRPAIFFDMILDLL